jgi:hypothetical protein
MAKEDCDVLGNYGGLCKDSHHDNHVNGRSPDPLPSVPSLGKNEIVPEDEDAKEVYESGVIYSVDHPSPEDALAELIKEVTVSPLRRLMG